MTTSTTIQEMKNPSIVLYGAKNAKLEDTRIPELSDPHHVLVRIAYVGVCGSDVSILFKHPPQASFSNNSHPNILSSTQDQSTNSFVIPETTFVPFSSDQVMEGLS
jgi:hypothetical protein